MLSFLVPHHRRFEMDVCMRMKMATNEKGLA
jgi:hypothetical protein